MRKWIDGIRANNKADTSTRIAEDDATWWIRNDYTRRLSLLEQSLCKNLPEKTSILFDLIFLNLSQNNLLRSQ